MQSPGETICLNQTRLLVQMKPEDNKSMPVGQYLSPYETRRHIKSMPVGQYLKVYEARRQQINASWSICQGYMEPEDDKSMPFGPHLRAIWCQKKTNQCQLVNL